MSTEFVPSATGGALPEATIVNLVGPGSRKVNDEGDNTDVEFTVDDPDAEPATQIDEQSKKDSLV